MKTPRSSGNLALLFLVMMTAVLPGAISHADNKPTVVSDSGDIFLPLVTAPRCLYACGSRPDAL